MTKKQFILAYIWYSLRADSVLWCDLYVLLWNRLWRDFVTSSQGLWGRRHFALVLLLEKIQSQQVHCHIKLFSHWLRVHRQVGSKLNVVEQRTERCVSLKAVNTYVSKTQSGEQLRGHGVWFVPVSLWVPDVQGHFSKCQKIILGQSTLRRINLRLGVS